MARLPRLAVAGLPHLVLQRGHNGQPVFEDDADRAAYLSALREGAAHLGVAIQGYALAQDRVLLLLTPPTESALGRLIQGLGRRYVAGFNRRHARRGTLWDGRYRASPLEPETALLPAMRYVDALPVRCGLAERAADWAWSSARHHLGQRREPLMSDSPAYWRLGNTPFDRELAYARLLTEPLEAHWVQRFDKSAASGWAIGSTGFVGELARRTARPLVPRPRGRPRKAPVEPSSP